MMPSRPVFHETVGSMSFHNLIKTLQDFWTDEEAATAVEYAVMLALIIVACLGSVSALSNATADSFNDTANAISAAFN